MCPAPYNLQRAFTAIASCAGPTTLGVSFMVEMGDQGPEGRRDQHQVANLKPGPGKGFHN